MERGRVSWYLALSCRLGYNCQRKGSGSNRLPQERKGLIGFIVQRIAGSPSW